MIKPNRITKNIKKEYKERVKTVLESIVTSKCKNVLKTEKLSEKELDDLIDVQVEKYLDEACALSEDVDEESFFKGTVLEGSPSETIKELFPKLNKTKTVLSTWDGSDINELN